MNTKVILEGIIKGYRQTLYDRYQYETINDAYEIPDSIDENTVNQLRDYFLAYMYPEFDKRQALNEAFDSLDDYIKNPKKLLSILLDTSKLIYSYGRHLPKILYSGINALKSFRAATNFENNLVEKAITHQITPPYYLPKIDQLIQLLARKEIEKFIDTTQSLFEVLHDKTLITKIKEIVQYLIKTMRKKKEFYTESQIKGLEIGYEMINEGYILFDQLSKEDQKNLIQVITQIERDNLDRIFDKSV